MKGISLEDIRRIRQVADTASLDKAFEEAKRELPLAALRQASGVTQAQMAERLGKSQAAVSKFEGRGDFLWSTLYRYARSIGASIDLTITIKGREFDLVAKDDESDIYFSLAERLHDRAMKANKEVGNVIQFKDRALPRKKGWSIGPGWIHQRGSVAAEDMTEVFFNMVVNNDEKKSAAA